MPVTDARPTKRGHKYRASIVVTGPKPEKAFKKFYKALMAATKPKWIKLTETKPPRPKRKKK